MNIFIINSGSSSIKYQLFKMPSTQPICVGLVERIGSENAVIRHKTFINGGEQVTEQTLHLPDHEAGLKQVVELLTDVEIGVLQNPADIEIVGHRVVHGGEKYKAATVINETVKAAIKELFSLAPLHNPANYTGIEVAEKIFTAATQVAVFDTAFHQTVPPYAYRYAIPKKWYVEEGIRSYGFHGTSHKYVSEKAMEYLNNPQAKIISIHLGNGCSMTAIDGGKSIDTSMGFGPLSGLVMGTRSGDIDPSVIFHLTNERGHSAQEISNILNKQSGMLGMTGHSDMRDVNKAVEDGDEEAELACQIYAYRVQQYIGSYIAALKGLDAILFTAGVGENDSRMRERICTGMEVFNITIDTEKNGERSSSIREINLPDAKVKVLVVPTNEELEIANQCMALLSAEAEQMD
jgi:acetate kinase